MSSTWGHLVLRSGSNVPVEQPIQHTHSLSLCCVYLSPTGDTTDQRVIHRHTLTFGIFTLGEIDALVCCAAVDRVRIYSAS